MGTLYIVSTPIGNKDDITLRALKILLSVDLILAEDTRKTKQLLELHSTKEKPQILSFYEQNEEARINQVINELNEGRKVALVSNAGTPLVSDPGFKLVRRAIAENIKVIPLPGASALLAGLVISGLPTDKFLFLGFLPKKSGKKQKLLEKVLGFQASLPQTVIFYESPFRIIKTLKLLKEAAPSAQVVIGRELTKKFEQVIRGNPEELLKKLDLNKKIKGELVVLFHSSF